MKPRPGFRRVMVGEQRRDLLEEPGRQRLAQLRSGIALIEAQERGIDMGADMGGGRKRRSQRREVALGAGQGDVYPADHPALPRPSPSVGSQRRSRLRRNGGADTDVIAKDNMERWRTKQRLAYTG